MMTSKNRLMVELNTTPEKFGKLLNAKSLTDKQEYSEQEVLILKSSADKGFTPNTENKAKRQQAEPTAPTAAPTTSTAIPQAREGAIAISATSAQAMNSLQSAGLQNAAAYVQRKQQERNAIVDKVSDAIAYLSDPDVLEADIMNAAAAKVAARSNAWEYEHCTAWDGMFALPESSQRLLGGGLG